MPEYSTSIRSCPTPFPTSLRKIVFQLETQLWRALGCRTFVTITSLTTRRRAEKSKHNTSVFNRRNSHTVAHCAGNPSSAVLTTYPRLILLETLLTQCVLMWKQHSGISQSRLWWTCIRSRGNSLFAGSPLFSTPLSVLFLGQHMVGIYFANIVYNWRVIDHPQLN